MEKELWCQWNTTLLFIALMEKAWFYERSTLDTTIKSTTQKKKTKTFRSQELYSIE